MTAIALYPPHDRRQNLPCLIFVRFLWVRQKGEDMVDCDGALFGVCVFSACRIRECCTLLTQDTADSRHPLHTIGRICHQLSKLVRADLIKLQHHAPTFITR
jgi:hypothetical protein